MKYLRVVTVSVLLAAPCVLLAWGAMAIGQSAGVVVDQGSAPAPPAPTPGTPSPNPFAPGEGRSGGGAIGGGMFGGAGRGASPRAVYGEAGGVTIGGRRVSLIAGTGDPLKDVTDLAKAEEPRLQVADQYLESKTRDLAQQYTGAEDAEAKAKLKAELTQTIEKHFDVRHEIRKREIDELETRVKKLREHLAKRGEARQSIVQMRLGQFVSAAEGLGWDADLGGGRSAGYGAGRYVSPYDGPSYPSSGPVFRSAQPQATQQNSAGNAGPQPKQ